MKNHQIDFEFMENFIQNIAEEYISELEINKQYIINRYLQVSICKNYSLTDEEKKVIDDFNNNKIEFKDFTIQELFSVSSSRKKFDANKVAISNDGFAYVVRSSLNNGIKGYIKEDRYFLNEANTISFGQDTATIFYQENPYFTGDKIKILKPLNDAFNNVNAQFFISSMDKSFKSFSWGSSSFNTAIIKHQKIKLPITNNIIDYKLMEIFILSIQKLVINDIVDKITKEIKILKDIVLL